MVHGPWDVQRFTPLAGHSQTGKAPCGAFLAQRLFHDARRVLKSGAVTGYSALSRAAGCRRLANSSPVISTRTPMRLGGHPGHTARTHQDQTDAVCARWRDVDSKKLNAGTNARARVQQNRPRQNKKAPRGAFWVGVHATRINTLDQREARAMAAKLLMNGPAMRGSLIMAA